MTHKVPGLRDEKGVLTKHRRPLDALTGVRFFAASYVILYHSRTQAFLHEHGEKLVGNFIESGYLAVTLFFMLSGFILAYTYRQQIETGRDKARFFEARFARIWPAYAFSLLASSLTTATVPTLAAAAATLFMVQAWNPLHPEYAGLVNAVCWSLSVECFFYLCFPMLQTRLERLSLRWLQACAACTLAICVLADTAGHGLSNQARWVPLPVVHLPEFVLGIAMGNIFLCEDAGKPRRKHGLLTWLGVAAAAAVLCMPFGAWTGSVVVGFSLLIYGLATESTWVARLLSKRLFLWGGAISYSMYLLQQIMRIWVRRMLLAAHAYNSATNFTISFAVIVVAALATYVWLEEPARKSLRAKFAGRR